jgi:hypothetical protein
VVDAVARASYDEGYPKDGGETTVSANLISLGSLVVAIVAFVVSYFAYRVQKRSQVSTDEQNLNDLIEKIESSLATVAQPQASFSLESFAAQNAALATLQGQALEARSLASRLAKDGIELDWFQNMVIAFAFTQAWDPAGAEDFWEGAVNSATTTQAHIRSLTARAQFYYSRGLNDDGHNDWHDARVHWQAALDELRSDRDRQGADLVAEQAAFMKFQQAGFEYNTGDESKAVSLVADAFSEANSVSAPGRKLAALERLGSLVQAMGNQMILPPNVVSMVADELSRRGVDPETFPHKTRALLSMPADGSQLSKHYGEGL